MKIFTKSPNENWIIDRYKSEFDRYNISITTNSLDEADIIWLLDGYTWREIPEHYLREKFVVNTITHIAPEKFDFDAFKMKDSFVNHYHAMSEKSAADVRQFTDKPVTPITFWVNENIWKEHIGDFDELRKTYNLPTQKVLVGSFQRDTEGHDLVSPKLVKGPDLFCDYIELMYSHIEQNLEVVLTGWRRQYVMNRLDQAGIKYHYFEMCDFKTMNDLYNCLDLYVVSSRIEGGPQAIPECAMTRTPIISTDVGLAPEILAPKSVNNELNKAMPDVDYAYDQVQKYTMENHMKTFVDFFEESLNGYN